VVAAYNVYFDVGFLDYELRDAVGWVDLPPHLCLMYLRPMLGLGPRCSLEDACRQHGIAHVGAHATSADVRAASRLLGLYLDAMKERRIETFGDLANLKSYKFVASFRRDPISPPDAMRARPAARLKPRRVRGAAPVAESDAATALIRAGRRDALSAYWNALKAALADLQMTDEEIRDLKRKKEDLGLKDEEVRVLHARAFMSVISTFSADSRLDDRERKTLNRLHRCLSQLGYAPGD